MTSGKSLRMFSGVPSVDAPSETMIRRLDFSNPAAGASIMRLRSDAACSACASACSTRERHSSVAPFPGAWPGEWIAESVWPPTDRQERVLHLAAGEVPLAGRLLVDGPAEPAVGRKGPSVTGEPTGDRALRSPRTEKQRAGTLASGARRQAKRDSR